MIKTLLQIKEIGKYQRKFSDANLKIIVILLGKFSTEEWIL